MAANKYLANSVGVITEVVASQVSAGAGDANKIAALDSTGHLDNSLLPTGIGADTALITASEALAAGDLVNVWNSTGAKVRKADASVSGKEAHGFVLAAVSNAGTATVYFEGTNTQVSGQTPGVVYLSATTPGAAVAAAPSGSGQVVQRVGYATSATAINFQSHTPIVLA
ncbi:MAG: hypothetical protein LC792_04140 [Actinobacteria bacterium]|nr:hypothetical protein [Actinomycetota bacterium]